MVRIVRALVRGISGAVCLATVVAVLVSSSGLSAGDDAAANPPRAPTKERSAPGPEDRRDSGTAKSPARKPPAKSAEAAPAEAEPAGEPQKSAKAVQLVPSVVETADHGSIVWTAPRVSRPAAVDIDRSGRRLVADRNLNRVFVYDADGGLVAELEVGTPLDADFLPGGGYLVVSGRRSAVIELDAAGKEVWSYDDLKAPRDADRLANGNTLIADTKPSRILEVDAGGNVVWQHSEKLRLPVDVELDADGNVVVADYNGHCVTCIRRDGSTCWRVNEIGHPSSLTMRGDGSLVVATHKAGSLLWVGPDRRVLGNWVVGADLEDFALAEGRRLLLAQRLRGDTSVDAGQVVRALGRIFAGLPLHPPPAPLRVVDGVDTTGKNIVLILFDSLRRDHVPWHGYWRPTAPVLDRLAAGGLIFDQYVTHAPWTKPSVASLFTSTLPSVHGATKQTPESQLPASLQTLAEVLRDAGYYTIGVMENPHMGDRNSTKGFEQGFDSYEYVKHRKRQPGKPRRVARAAIKALEGRPAERPFFLTMFFMNPHYPYEPDRKLYGERDAGPSNPGPINEYDAEIREADAAVGSVLDFLSRASLDGDTIVVFSSDHGEEFGDHGNRFHGDTLYDCVLAVPFVVSGLDRAGRFPGLVRQVDVMPTLLDFVGVEIGPDLREQIAGTSVRPFLEPGVRRTGLVSYAQSRFRDNVHLIGERTESRKVIADLESRRAMIFDLQRDPQEYDNLASKEESAAELARLSAWEEQLGHAVADAEAGPTEPIPEEVLERLRAAGYLGNEP